MDMITAVANSIIELCAPKKIILISKKISVTHELIGFKLCLIIDDNTSSLSELECNLYMQIECDIPFDLVLYKNAEWDDLKNDEGTFARKILNTGTVLYG